jgi:hypothetical protein
MLMAAAIEQAQRVARLHPAHLRMPRGAFGQGEFVVLDQRAVDVQA